MWKRAIAMILDVCLASSVASLSALIVATAIRGVKETIKGEKKNG